jgi:hypothetical protein
MGSYSAIKKNKILSFAGKQMELEVIMLSEIARLRKTNTACFCSYAEARPKGKKDININVGVFFLTCGETPLGTGRGKRR